ncbi:MAG: hypothetical protein J6Y02_15225 [Pseudobutyrivibrio sp.]|nr:hypothetical protein [Pseudobutyrivibrio sp.]
MKKFVTILLTFTLLFSICTVSTFAASSSGKITVKKATYQKYKKAYQNQKKLKTKINKLERKVAIKQSNYEDAMDQYEIAMEENEKLEKAYAELETKYNALIEENTNSTLRYTEDEYDSVKEALEDAEWQRDWLWNNINSMGITYSDKTWTIPAELPDKFIINRTTYKVIKEEI